MSPLKWSYFSAKIANIQYGIFLTWFEFFVHVHLQEMWNVIEIVWNARYYSSKQNVLCRIQINFFWSLELYNCRYLTQYCKDQNVFKAGRFFHFSVICLQYVNQGVGIGIFIEETQPFEISIIDFLSHWIKNTKILCPVCQCY